MVQPDSAWPPPPAIPPPPEGGRKWHTRTKTTILLLLCYIVLWPCLFAVAVCLFDPRLFVFIVFGWQMFVVLIFVQPCLHLPGVMLFQRLQCYASGNVVVLTSAVWASILASGHWMIYNYLWGGYDPACDPDIGFFWVCGIPGILIVPFLVAGSVTGYLVGRLLAKRQM